MHRQNLSKRDQPWRREEQAQLREHRAASRGHGGDRNSNQVNIQNDGGSRVDVFEDMQTDIQAEENKVWSEILDVQSSPTTQPCMGIDDQFHLLSGDMTQMFAPAT